MVFLYAGHCNWRPTDAQLGKIVQYTPIEAWYNRAC